MAEPGPEGRAELPRNVEMQSPNAILDIQANLDRRAYEPLNVTARDLLTLTAPAPYATEYRTFEKLLSDTDFELDRLRQIIDRLEQSAIERRVGAYRNALTNLLDANMIVFPKVMQLIDRGRLLQLNECVLGLAGIGTELQLLNDAFVV